MNKRYKLVQEMERKTAELNYLSAQLKAYDLDHCGAMGCDNIARNRTYCNDHVATLLNKG